MNPSDSTRRELSTSEIDRLGGRTLLLFVLSLCLAPLLAFAVLNQHGSGWIALAGMLACITVAVSTYRVAARLVYPAQDSLLQASEEPTSALADGLLKPSSGETQEQQGEQLLRASMEEGGG